MVGVGWFGGFSVLRWSELSYCVGWCGSWWLCVRSFGCLGVGAGGVGYFVGCRGDWGGGGRGGGGSQCSFFLFCFMAKFAVEGSSAGVGVLCLVGTAFGCLSVCVSLVRVVRMLGGGGRPFSREIVFLRCVAGWFGVFWEWCCRREDAWGGTLWRFEGLDARIGSEVCGMGVGCVWGRGVSWQGRAEMG